MPQESPRITILIVDDIADTRSNLTKLLQFEPDMQVVGSVGSGREGIARARELRPHIVLMDINLPDIDGITATELITRDVPGTAVVMLSVQDETDYLRRAMQAGARQFLVKPFSGAELAGTIRQVNALEAPRRQLLQASTRVEEAAPARVGDGKVFALFSPKGGVGCSTLAVNLAVALKQVTSGRVALLDGSMRFGDVALMLNLTDIKTIADVVPSIDQLDEDLLLGVMATHGTGVQVLASPPRPELAELVTAEVMKKVLGALRATFDYVVVDTAGTFDDIGISILDAADRVLLTLTLEMPCVKNARLFLELADALKYPKDKVALVANRVEGKQGIGVVDVERSVHRRVTWTVESARDAAVQAINQGVPLLVSQREVGASRDIRAIASALTSEGAVVEVKPESESRRPLFSSGRSLAFLGKRG